MADRGRGRRPEAEAGRPISAEAERREAGRARAPTRAAYPAYLPGRPTAYPAYLPGQQKAPGATRGAYRLPTLPPTAYRDLRRSERALWKA